MTDNSYTHIALPVKVFEQLFKYLTSCPYSEVSELVTTFNNEARPIRLTPKEEEFNYEQDSDGDESLPTD